MLRKYNITQDAESHLSAAHPSSQEASSAKRGVFARRLLGCLRRHQLEFWVVQLVFAPLLFLLVLAFLMMVIGLLTEGTSSLV